MSLLDTRARTALAIAALSFAGCGGREAEQPTDAQESTPIVRQLERGEAIGIITTSSGPEARNQLQAIIDGNPDKRILEIERAGAFVRTSGFGAGFIVVLEPGMAKYELHVIGTSEVDEAAQGLSQILNASPNMKLFAMERTGGHNHSSSFGAGFLVILEEREGNK